MKLLEKIAKSFPMIEKLFTETTRLEFLHTPREKLEKYDYGLGTMIRLKVLRPKSSLYKTFIKNGYVDEDEMAMKIIKEFHEYICDKI